MIIKFKSSATVTSHHHGNQQQLPWNKSSPWKLVITIATKQNHYANWLSPWQSSAITMETGKLWEEITICSVMSSQDQGEAGTIYRKKLLLGNKQSPLAAWTSGDYALGWGWDWGWIWTVDDHGAAQGCVAPGDCCTWDRAWNFAVGEHLVKRMAVKELNYMSKKY